MKKSGKKAGRAKASAKPAKPAKQSKPVKRVAKELPAGQSLPTRDGEVVKSSWKSRTHMRTKNAKDSDVLCQRNTKSEIWKRDMVSVGPGKDKEVSCRRCIKIMKAQKAAA